jgi:hypothetical protein
LGKEIIVGPPVLRETEGIEAGHVDQETTMDGYSFTTLTPMGDPRQQQELARKAAIAWMHEPVQETGPGLTVRLRVAIGTQLIALGTLLARQPSLRSSRGV